MVGRCGVAAAVLSAVLAAPPAAGAQERAPAGAAAEAPAREPAEETPRGRFEDAVETDRDAFTPTTQTVDRRRLVVESSYSFIDNRAAPETHSFPELLLRYGLFERVELRLGWNYEVGAGGNAVSGVEGDEGLEGAKLEREHRLLYGVKARLTEQAGGLLPDSSVILQGFTPTGGDATATQLTAGYVFGWRLPNRVRLDASLRYATDSDAGGRFSEWAPSAVVRVPFGERWQAHAEYFGLFSQGKPADLVHHYFSPGAHFLVTPDLEIGVRLGWGLNEQSSRFFTNAGVGWRF